MPKRPCLECGTLTGNASRCDLHQAAWSSANNRRRGSATARGYGSAWRAIAKSVLSEHRATEGERCPGHGVAPHVSSDLTVDHIVPRSKGGTDERNNLRVLCRSCNARKRDSM